MLGLEGGVGIEEKDCFWLSASLIICKANAAPLLLRDLRQRIESGWLRVLCPRVRVAFEGK